MPSWASATTSSASTRYAIHLGVPGVDVVGRSAVALLLLSLVASEHRRSLVFEILVVKQRPVRCIMIRWCYPFPWYDARQRYAYASGAVQPAGCGAARQVFAQVRGEVVAVLGEQVVGGALELLRGLGLVVVSK